MSTWLLLDAHGRPIQSTGVTPVAPPELTEVSYEGIERATEEAFINEIRIPRDTILKDHGRSDPTFYEGLRRDEQVQSTFSRRRYSVVAKEWKVEPGGETELDKQAAAHLEAQLKAISWDRITFRMLAGLWPGYSVSECLFKLEDNVDRSTGAMRYPLGASRLLELRTIKVRRAGRFRWTNGGELRLLTTKDPKGLKMPDRKFWIFTCGADDDDEPYGLGLAYYCYWAIWFKRNAAKFWALFLERFALPLPKAVVPPGTKDEERDKIKDALDAFVAGGRLVVSKGVEVSLEQAMKDSGGDFQRFIDIWNAAISKVILTQTMTTDDAATKAGGTVHMQGEEVVVKSDADLVNESFMSGPAAWLTEANFPGAKTPIVSRVFEQAEDLNALADRDTKHAQVGWKRTKESFEKTFGEGYEYSAPAPAAPDPSAPAPTAFAELLRLDAAIARRARHKREALDARRALERDFARSIEDFGEGDLGDVGAAIDRLLADDGWRRVVGPEVDALESLIAEASSLEEVRDRLGELAKRDPSKMTEVLAKILFAAQISGEEGADVGRS